MNAELAALFEADQNDRKQGTLSGHMAEAVAVRDRMRRERVADMITAGDLQSPEDYLQAAFIFQHGEQLEDYWKAHELAKRAVELGHPEMRKARWMAAATYDRWLTNQGKPQKYGTQYWKDQNGWRLMDYDPTSTDEERAQWGVPPLAEALRRADELNQRDAAAKRSPPVG
ncbi:MAG TPA: hypothetical protein VNT01_13115 [Symbiobacteriaceae bacterium]|nr:hypothetical protein [Symbiobacteriaceae bacterium]